MDKDTDVLGILFERAKRTGRPATVHFELTYECNLNCRHCYVVNDREKEMTTEQAKHALDNMADAGVLILTFTGGEVLVRDDFFEIARHAQNLDFSVRLFTNGTLVDEGKADLLAGLNLLEIGVSLYGARPETHEGITRVEGSFRKTIDCINLLTERGVSTKVKSVIMKPNFSEYSEIIAIAESMGAACQLDTTVVPRDDGGRLPLELRMDEHQLEVVLSDLAQRDGKAGTGEPMICRGPICDLDSVSLGISPKGEIFPCLQLKMPIGNIVKERLLDVSKNMSENKAIKVLTNIDLLEECTGCKTVSFCTRCPGISFLEEGNALGKSSWACKVARIRSKTAI